ncbi:GntR family transcriptional regulator [Streptomyces griseorubiginosus]|uniref:GntR family transcriptional regulator n=1 Tax=Streptomyces griseorubiginosus TaxID=67304 RepID=UPI002E806F8E|nr:GntR family transcriptional regulator [Streptomyces griseorubiginosus]WUB58857.1 GntR family transcriptional regulator [Streptomyces griseorubiginosus]
MATRYEEIADDLRERISAGEFPAGSTLPGYDQLTLGYKASRATLREALNRLQAEGLVRPVKKKGLVVRDPGERRQVARGSVVRRDPARGYVFPAASAPDEPWVTHGRPGASTMPAPAPVAERLGIAPGTRTVRQRWITSPAGQSPFQITDAWIHPDLLAETPQLGEPGATPGTYLDRIEEAGHGPLEWEERTTIRPSSREEAKQLEIPAAMWVFEVVTVGTSHRTGQAAEVSIQVIPGDRVEFVTKLRRDRTARWPVAPAASAGM